MRSGCFVLSSLIVACLVADPASAGWSSQGEVALEARGFLDDNDDTTVDRGLGMMGRVQIDHRSKPFKERLRIYGRLDREDPERTLLVVEEAWVQWKFKPFKLKLKY